jgi:hypothetical protein
MDGRSVASTPYPRFSPISPVPERGSFRQHSTPHVTAIRDMLAVAIYPSNVNKSPSGQWPSVHCPRVPDAKKLEDGNSGLVLHTLASRRVFPAGWIDNLAHLAQ